MCWLEDRKIYLIFALAGLGLALSWQVRQLGGNSREYLSWENEIY